VPEGEVDWEALEDMLEGDHLDAVDRAYLFADEDEDQDKVDPEESYEVGRCPLTPGLSAAPPPPPPSPPPPPPLLLLLLLILLLLSSLLLLLLPLLLPLFLLILPSRCLGFSDLN
jgi:hypothetical protein